MPGARNESVFLNTWYSKWPEATLPGDPMDEEFWRHVLEVREAVNRKLEALREKGSLGANLEAEVDIFCADDYLTKLKKLSDELRFVMITSAARVHELKQVEGDGEPDKVIFVEANPSGFTKCVRCWHRRPEVGQDPEHPQLCGRCVENVSGTGEQRLYA